ncbi:1-aminocyclopropane-1-carboxylate deaminase/D-cysteine desulfhydrase [Nitratifractor sp.]
MQRLAIPSPMERIRFEGREYFLKRDDLIHPDFSGNKARKFYHWLLEEAPEIRKVISYGSVQSNAMYSLSVLARMRGWEFEYFVDHIPDWLRRNPIGNYKAALENGAVFNEKKEMEKKRWGEEVFFIEEGGRQPEAEEGVRLLAREIVDWQREAGSENLTVFFPSGTGTTALYLQKSLRSLTLHSSLRTKVVTTPCVGGARYLRQQFAMLESDEKFWPTILETRKKYHFGKLYREFYRLWLELYRQTGVEFDLLYDPKGWLTLCETKLCESGGEILYLHQGGLKGNESMLPRYRRKYPEMDDEF